VPRQGNEARLDPVPRAPNGGFREKEEFYGTHAGAAIKLLDGVGTWKAAKLDTSPRLNPGVA
jgi:hypothetical protein